MNQRGFSLVEIMIAMGIATFLIAGAMTAHVSNLSYYKTTESRSSLYQDSLLLIEYLRGELMQAGGGSVRAWMGIWVEDACLARAPLPACANSDRVTVSTVSIPLQECAITGQVNPTTVQVAFNGPTCCLQPVAANEVTFLNRQVMFTLGDFYSSQYATVVNLITCQMTTVAGQSNQRPPALWNWGNGVVTMVNVQTLYWDSINRMLKRWINTNNDNAKTADEDAIIADQVFDMQYALGYDFNVPDGNINETPTGINDEWLFNAPTVVEVFGAGVFAPPVVPSQLLSMQVGTIVGSDDAAAGFASAPKRSLNGPLRSLAGWMMMEEIARFSPRNSYIFQ